MKIKNVLKNLLGVASVVLAFLIMYRFFGTMFAIFTAVGMAFVLWDIYKSRRD